MTADVEFYSERLRRLEHANKLLWLVISCFAFCAGVMCVSAAAPPLGGGTIEAEEFALRGKDGKRWGSFNCFDGEPGISLYRYKLKPAIVISTSEITAYDSNTSPRFKVEFHRNGNTSMTMFNKNGELRFAVDQSDLNHDMLTMTFMGPGGKSLLQLSSSDMGGVVELQGADIRDKIKLISGWDIFPPSISIYNKNMLDMPKIHITAPPTNNNPAITIFDNNSNVIFEAPVKK